MALTVRKRLAPTRTFVLPITAPIRVVGDITVDTMVATVITVTGAPATLGRSPLHSRRLRPIIGGHRKTPEMFSLVGTDSNEGTIEARCLYCVT